MPIALALLMPLLASGLAVAWWRGWLPKRAWVLAVVLQGLLVVSGVMAMRTGEADEERVERVVAEHLIEAHEEAAEVFVWSGAAVFALALGAGLVRRDQWALVLAGVTAAGTVAVLGLGYRVGEAGGSLVYTHGAASAFVTASGAKSAPPVGEAHHDDD